MFNHWVTILLTIAAVGGAIVTIYGWVRAPIRWWRSRKKKALSFAQNDVFWTIGKLDDQRGGLGCLNRFSASISGASAGVRLPSGAAAG